MNHIEKAIQFILSEDYLDFVVSNNKWCHHGSSIIHFFEDEELIFEYGNTRLKKKIIKDYIQDKINSILLDIEDESPEFLYRAVYLEKKPKEKDFYGFFWSSKEVTAPCIENTKELNEYLLEIEYNETIVDWKETLMSRMDYVYGDREKEYYLKDKIVSLNSCKLI